MTAPIHTWNIAKATAKAAEKNDNVGLTRSDGTSSGLMVTPAGELRSTKVKPQGKAARKQFKALKRQLRELGPGDSASTVRIIKRRALSLCEPKP